MTEEEPSERDVRRASASSRDVSCWTHGLVPGKECRLEVDETREGGARQTKGKVSLCSMWRLTCSHLQATAEGERIVDGTQDLKTKRTKPASRTPPDRTKVVKLVLNKWLVDKGCGFGKVPTAEIVFIHASVVRGAEVLTISTDDAWLQLVRDDARAQGEVSSTQSLGTRRVERGERQREEGKQSGRASKSWQLGTCKEGRNSVKPLGVKKKAKKIHSRPICADDILNSHV